MLHSNNNFYHENTEITKQDLLILKIKNIPVNIRFEDLEPNIIHLHDLGILEIDPKFNKQENTYAICKSKYPIQVQYASNTKQLFRPGNSIIIVMKQHNYAKYKQYLKDNNLCN